MFEMLDRYDMYSTQNLKFKPKPTVLHQKTCPICDGKRVNVYYSDQLEKYICRKCIDKLVGEKDGADMRGEGE